MHNSSYTKMKKLRLLLFALVFGSISIAQQEHHFHDYFSIHEMILGEWELEKTIIIDGDSVYCELLPTSKKSLRIDEKSVAIIRDSIKHLKTVQFSEFYYDLTYSEETTRGQLSLYFEELKKKRKMQRAWVNYYIKYCDFNHLILNQFNISPLAEKNYDNYTYLVYKRKQVNKFGFDDFAGTWHFFGDNSLNLGEHTSNEPIRLTKTFDTLKISSFRMEGSLTFYFGTLKNHIIETGQSNRYRNHFSLVIREDGTFYTVIDGVYLRFHPHKNFWIDFKNQLIYLLHESISVYHFDFDDEGALILTWDMERTKNLKKIERR